MANKGRRDARWKWVKRKYNELPQFLRVPFTLIVSAPEEAKGMARSLVRLRPQPYVKTWTEYHRNRGMSHWRDIVDWVGAHPYEGARVDEIFEFYRRHGCALEKLKNTSGLGSNEFVFVRER